MLHIYKDEDNQEKADKDNEDDIGCNENMTVDDIGVVTTNIDDSKKVKFLIGVYIIYNFKIFMNF